MSEPYMPGGKRIALERLLMAAGPRRVSKAILHDAKFSVEQTMDELAYRLEAYVMAAKVDAVTSSRFERVPKTWWDHFKLEAIKWGNPFFDPEKIRYTRLELTTRYRTWATFPECPVQFPSELGPPVMWIQAQDLDGADLEWS